MSYSIPVSELTNTDIKGFKQGAIEAGILTALSVGIAGNRGQLVVREAFPNTDFGSPIGAGWLIATGENYINPVIAGLGWGSPFSGGALPGAVPQLARTKVAVFYKFANTSTTPLTTGVRFRVGATGASTKATFFIQLPTEAKLEPDVYFSEPIVYEPEDFVYLELYYTAAVAVGAQTIPFGCFIIERIGGNVS